MSTGPSCGRLPMPVALMPDEDVRFTFRLPSDAAGALPGIDPARLRGSTITFRCMGRESQATVEEAVADDRGLLVTMVISDQEARPSMEGGSAESYSPVTSPGPQADSADQEPNSYL
jgi:hypothetical protein